MGRIVSSLRAAWRTVSPLGRVLVALAVACWALAAWWGWRELRVMAASLVLLCLVSAAFTLGRLDLSTSLRVEPSRVEVGQRAAGAITLVNNRRRAARSLRLELPVGLDTAPFSIEKLKAGEPVEELFVVPTHRRAVIPVGPAVTVQGDPLGLLRRTRTWSQQEEIYVHPATTALNTLAAGLLRDLEGQTTNHLSPADIAFHTLRDYVPGDDRRHVHWKSSAKSGRLLVRQYVDTRRSHVAVLLSTDLAEYASDDEFELAISCAASVAMQAIRDEQTLTMLIGGERIATEDRKHLLDRFSAIQGRAGHGGTDACLRLARRVAADASVAVMCLGSRLGVPEIRRAATRVGLNTTTLVVRADLAATAGYRIVGSSKFVNVPALGELNRCVTQVLS